VEREPAAVDRATGAPAETVGPSGRRRRTFHSLGVRNFRLFLIGQLVSTTGTWMQSVAAPFLVLQLTHSGVALGIDTGLQFLPILLFGAWGGVIADRFDNRRVQLATQVAYAVLASALWLLVVTDLVQVWMVYALSFGAGLVTAVDMPTRQSFYLEMVGREDLTNAMSLNTATFTGTRVAGPALAGVLIARVGVAPVFLINAASYVAVVLALLAMNVSTLRARRSVPRRPGQIREGVRYIWRTPGLRVPMLIMAPVFLFGFNFPVLLPLLAVRTFDGTASTYGNMLALFGVGSLAGALVMASRATQPNTPRLAALALVVGGLSVAVGAAPALPIALLFLPLLGAAGISFAITGNSTLQLTSSDEMRGRVMALYAVVFLGSTPLGGPLAGLVGQHVGSSSGGPRIGLVGGGVVAVAAGAVALLALRWYGPARRHLLREGTPAVQHR
jgi:MFS family permease